MDIGDSNEAIVRSAKVRCLASLRFGLGLAGQVPKASSIERLVPDKVTGLDFGATQGFPICDWQRARRSKDALLSRATNSYEETCFDSPSNATESCRKFLAVKNAADPYGELQLTFFGIHLAIGIG